MDIYEQIKDRKVCVSIVGLGYVGLPLAVGFAKETNVIAFDIDGKKIQLYRQGIDITNEVGNEMLKETSAKFTYNESDLKASKFHIIAVPTPINADKTPNLEYVKNTSSIVGRNLLPGSILVYESTVYPGVTEDICIPILEKESGLTCGLDFKVGYSPERINPGDKVHRVESIKKIVSGMDEETLDTIGKVYELVIKAGVYRAKSIKVAEAAKVIENAQRDINIAFMNELSIIFNKLGIDTLDVLEAAKTKWNFLDFTPGLVGGHCIGIDPYYLTHKAEEIGYHSQIILAGRRINDDMGKYIAENTIKCLIKADVPIKGAKVLLMGITFKENCADVRNSKAIDIIHELQEYGVDVTATDPIASEEEVLTYYQIKLGKLEDVNDMNGVIITVKHDAYKELIFNDFVKKFKKNKPVIIDVKGLFHKEDVEKRDVLYWRL